MSLVISNVLGKNSVRILEDRLMLLSISCSPLQSREVAKKLPRPKLRNPTWFVKKTRSESEEYLTPENKQFIKEVVEDKYHNIESFQKEPGTNIEWTPKMQRTGVIARKIGIYPMWFQNGKKIATTLLQVLDNHVIKYFEPDAFEPPRKRVGRIYNKKACLMLGAEGVDPSTLTKEYCGLFKESGVIPKKFVARFFTSPDAAIPLGTLINVMHFQVGNAVDVRGKTIDRGFQGVMKRHGFKGMPASHGVTKTHRRGGNIGGGGEKARVWPGTKMPGHMGNRYRVARGLQILRINTKYNVMWVTGQAIPGETNSIVYIFDSKLPLRKPTSALPFPTYYGAIDENTPEDIYDESVHKFTDPPIVYSEVK